MQAKKSLGQNFLKCGWALTVIIKNANLNKESVVLEIGPGTGLLTERLLETGASVIAVEKDDRLIPVLQHKFKDALANKTLTLIHGDILDIEIRKILPLPNIFSVIANIPYYITGQFIRIMLESEHQPQNMILMLQKEVVKRIIATDKKESLLSLSIKAYGTARKVIDVPKECFTPMPNVDSAVLQIEHISKDYFKDFSETKFFETIRAGFGQKRKQLAGNLANHFNKKTEEIKLLLAQAQIPENARAETLTLEQWANLIRLY